MEFAFHQGLQPYEVNLPFAIPPISSNDYSCQRVTRLIFCIRTIVTLLHDLRLCDDRRGSRSDSTTFNLALSSRVDQGEVAVRVALTGGIHKRGSIMNAQSANLS